MRLLDTSMYKKYIPSLLFFLILFLAFGVYAIGLKGSFLFDDYPNLSDLGTYGTIDSWDKAYNFINGGFAGPTGRPISLATFLLDANTWPASPYSFKYTNLMLHLLNGALLFWAVIVLLRNYAYEESKVIWVALLTTAFWLLHPYFVSTTLYVVQRMAQLAALFSLVGIIGYLKFRSYLPTKPFVGYIGMTLVLGIATVLATYSKENGALLPLLILVIEFCHPRAQIKLMWQWKWLCLYIPSLIILYILARSFTLAENPWPNRNFNMIERLYSEARIVTEYLFNLFIPQVELRGLYQDGYQISRSLFKPITTLFSVIFLFILLISAFLTKQRYPLYSLAILFFFTAHLMESTTIGLELYFEHRNYLAAIFLFLPVASGFYILKEKIDCKLVILIILIVLAVLSFFTYERAKLWSNVDKLQIYWAESSPNSARAQSSIAGILFDAGKIDEANQHLEGAIKRLPESALLNMRLLMQKVYSQKATEQDFQLTAERLKVQAFDAQAIQALRNLSEYIIEQQLVSDYGQWTLNLIDNLEANAVYNRYPLFQRLTPYLRAKIYLAKGNQVEFMHYYQLALQHYADVEAGMMMVAEVGSMGYTQEALLLLDQVENIYKNQSQSNLKRSKKEYDFEVMRVREILMDRIRDKKD